ncbi:MAG: ATP-binding protein [Candidatus Omnitrophica bacterium]|nr:ATP-binding protein [Candidatus Omnitrophota bacterium]MDD5429488.1 ATP-binding protein [Candidatus Omnitrophota bacterium]
MIISIASGKGGTGKTTIATSLALSLERAQILDCDVEEPNGHIFIKPRIKHKETIYIPVPEVDIAKCNFCGKCQQVCAYNAIAVVNKKVLIFPELCHGCGSCTYFCQPKALHEVNKEIGILERGSKEKLEFVHARLKLGEMMAPPLIKAVKKYINPEKVTIIDAPPGTSCPVITAIKGSDFVILVTEPTPFGLNDLVLAVEVVRKLGIDFGVVINRSDLGNEKTDEYCRRENIPILMKIPFKREIASAYSKGVPIVEAIAGYKEKFINLYENIKIRVKQI